MGTKISRRHYLLLVVAMAARLHPPRLAVTAAYHSHTLLIQRRQRRETLQRHCMSSSNQTIQSTKSATVRNIQALLNKRRKRLEAGSTIVEGPRMVMDLLDNPATRNLVKQVLVSSERPDWVEQIQQDHPSLFLQQGTPQVLNACSDTVTPQGIVAVVSIPDFELFKKQHPLYLVLDGVSDPGNVGTLLRSSVAVGAAGVVLLPHCCDVWNPKAVRSAMGCTFQMPIMNVESWNAAESLLKQWGVGEHIYAATMDKSGGGLSIPHFEVEWTSSPSALIIGSEGNGLSDIVRKDVAKGSIQATHVPMEPGIESLNAAVCGSVVLFEFLRQCRTQT